jgi:hypothetical protein
MRSAGNFHPEWGYLAPAPSFMRSARIAIVATAIGATAGAAVVFSLLDRPTPGPVADADKSMVVVRSLVQPAEAAAPQPAPAKASVTAAAPVAVSAPVAAPSNAQPSQQPKQQAAVDAAPAAPAQAANTGAADMPAAAAAATQAAPAATPDSPPSIAALTETAPAADAAPAAVATGDAAAAPEQAGAPKKTARKHSGERRRYAGFERGLPPIFRGLFSARSGPNYH